MRLITMAMKDWRWSDFRRLTIIVKKLDIWSSTFRKCTQILVDKGGFGSGVLRAYRVRSSMCAIVRDSGWEKDWNR